MLIRLLLRSAIAIASLFLATAGERTASAADLTGITGTVTSQAGAAVPGATIVVTGPTHTSTKTDKDGAFSLTLSPGLYRLTITKTGFVTISTADIAVVAGTSTPVSITLSEQTLTTLRQIGSVTTTGHGSATINVGAATQSYLSGSDISALANPQINDALQRIPDVTIEKLGTQADTAIVIGGLQPYETQVLIDGHPIALGQYGVFLTQYFPSYMLGGVETQSGPGNTTPFANIAVGGTANLQTIPFTKKNTFEFTQGVDNYASEYSNTIVTGSAGKASYVASLGFAGSNGPYFGKRECDVYESDPATTLNSANSAGIASFCGDFSGSLGTRAQLYKLRYDFSPSTSLDVGFLGSYGGYSPQGSAWGTSDGPTKIEGCIPGTLECTNPADANLIGKTINGFFWYPGTNIVNTQQFYDAQFRTTFAGTTLLVRPYIGTIQPETYVGNGEGGYAAFYAPNSSYPPCTKTLTTGCYPGPQSLPPGTQIPAGGLANPNVFESTACPVGNIYSYNQINSPSNTITSTNGQEECYQYPYSTYEQDKLYGTTFSLVREIENGNGSIDLTYDYHGQSTFAYDSAPSDFVVPMGSSTRYSTFSLTGSVAPIAKLAINFGLYDTNWSVVGEQPTFANGTQTGETGLHRDIAHIDPHLAFVYRADGSTSLRAAAGTSETFPFVGDVTGPSSFQPPENGYSGGVITEKNANLQPEYSEEYDIGGDHRFGRNSVLSLDFQNTVVHNVFQQLTTQENSTLDGNPVVVGIFTPINVARLEAQLVTLKYRHAPLFGFGYNVAMTADRSILSGIPASAFNATSVTLPADNVQVCGNAEITPGLATCIPYLKGYGQLNYTLNTGTYVALGVDYEGKNNAYYQPPFAILDFTYKEPFTKNLDFNLSVENLLNTNSYDYLPALNLGVPAVGDLSSDGKTIQQGSYPTYRLPAATRTLRASLRVHIGD